MLLSIPVGRVRSEQPEYGDGMVMFQNAVNWFA